MYDRTALSLLAALVLLLSGTEAKASIDVPSKCAVVEPTSNFFGLQVTSVKVVQNAAFDRLCITLSNFQTPGPGATSLGAAVMGINGDANCYFDECASDGFCQKEAGICLATNLVTLDPGTSTDRFCLTVNPFGAPNLPISFQLSTPDPLECEDFPPSACGLIGIEPFAALVPILLHRRRRARRSTRHRERILLVGLASTLALAQPPSASAEEFTGSLSVDGGSSALNAEATATISDVEPLVVSGTVDLLISYAPGQAVAAQVTGADLVIGDVSFDLSMPPLVTLTASLSSSHATLATPLVPLAESAPGVWEGELALVAVLDDGTLGSSGTAFGESISESMDLSLTQLSLPGTASAVSLTIVEAPPGLDVTMTFPVDAAATAATDPIVQTVSLAGQLVTGGTLAPAPPVPALTIWATWLLPLALVVFTALQLRRTREPSTD